MILVVKDSFMVCPNAWVCRLIVPSDLYSFLSHNHLASPNGAAELLLEGSRNIAAS